MTSLKGARLFLDDASHMTGQIKELLKELRALDSEPSLEPDRMHDVMKRKQEKSLELFRVVHNLKGTAAMVQGCESVVQVFHGIESILACQKPESYVEKLEWLPQAELALRQAETDLERFRVKVEMATASGEVEEPRGLLVRDAKTSRLVWFPMNSVLHVFHPDEIEGKNMVCFNGSWLPVVGSPIPGYLGIGVRGSAGRVVFVVKEIRGVFPKNQARELIVADSNKAAA